MNIVIWRKSVISWYVFNHIWWNYVLNKECQWQVRPVPANLSVVTFKEIFCWAKYPHTQTGLTNSACKSLGGSLSLNSIQIKTNSGNAHYNDQYTKVSFIFKMSKKSQNLKDIHNKKFILVILMMWRKKLWKASKARKKQCR